MPKIVLSLAVLFYSLPLFAQNKAAQSPAFEQMLKSMDRKYSELAQVPMPRLAKDVSASEVEDGRYWVTVWAANKEERTKLAELGLNIIEIKDGKVSGIIHEKDLPKLDEKDFIIDSKIPLSELITTYLKDFPAQDSAYHNYNEMLDVLKSLAEKNSDIASLYSIGKTVEGREIWDFRINSSVKGDAKSDKPGALFMGDHHAREHISVEVPLLFAVWLMENRNREDVRNYIYSLDIHIMPMINPDGAEYDISTGKYKWHRKNMRRNPDGNIGVDLNRNYDFRWGGAGASHSTYSDTYCGPKAFSEPETQAVKRFMEKHRNIKTAVSYHSYSELVLYPWGGIYDPVENEADRKAFIAMAGEMAKLTGYRAMQSSDLYAATGDTCDWMYGELGTFAFTIELPPKGGWYSGGFYPGPGIIKETVKENIDAAMYLLSVTPDPHSAVK